MLDCIGILMIKKASLTDNITLIKLWGHECSRVFRDRLIDDFDRQWFDKLLVEKLEVSLHQIYTGDPSSVTGTTIPTTEDTPIVETEDNETSIEAKSPENNVHQSFLWSTDDFVNLMYGNFVNPGKSLTKEYQPLPSDISTINKIFINFLDDYNVNFASTAGNRMELVFFFDAILHLIRLLRILSQPRGNAVLIGVGGSGRQSLAKLACFIIEYKCYQIEITRGYGKNEWRENIKDMLVQAGAHNQPCVFLFSDIQIVKELFLEDLNNLLNSGEIMNLYQPDDIEKICTLVRPLAKAAGKMETKDAILQHYVYLIRENLHIVLCMSPIGSSFRTRCRKFPSLVRVCF